MSNSLSHTFIFTAQVHSDAALGGGRQQLLEHEDSCSVDNDQPNEGISKDNQQVLVGLSLTAEWSQNHLRLFLNPPSWQIII